MCTICWTLVIWWWKSIIRFLIKARWNNGLFYETAVCGKRSNLNLHGTKSLQSHSPLYFWFVLVLLPHWCLCVHYCDSSTPLSTLWPDSIPMLIGSATDKHTSFVCLSLYYLTLRGINNTAQQCFLYQPSIRTKRKVSSLLYNHLLSWPPPLWANQSFAELLTFCPRVQVSIVIEIKTK